MNSIIIKNKRGQAGKRAGKQASKRVGLDAGREESTSSSQDWFSRPQQLASILGYWPTSDERTCQ